MEAQMRPGLSTVSGAVPQGIEDAVGGTSVGSG